MSRDRRSQSKELQFARTTTIKWEIPPPFCVVCRIELIKKFAIGPSLKAARWLFHVTWNITHHISSDVNKKNYCTTQASTPFAHQSDRNEGSIYFFVCRFTFFKNELCLPIYFLPSSRFPREHAGKFVSVRRDAALSLSNSYSERFSVSTRFLGKMQNSVCNISSLQGLCPPCGKVCTNADSVVCVSTLELPI